MEIIEEGKDIGKKKAFSARAREKWVKLHKPIQYNIKYVHYNIKFQGHITIVWQVHGFIIDKDLLT